jgi:N-acetylglutamate synthase
MVKTVPRITTREFVIADYDRAVALWCEVEGVEICEGDSRQEIRGYLERNPGLSRVAEENATMVGAVLCGHDGRRGWIYHLAVSLAYRGRGVGKLLLEECCRGLRSAGIKRAIILVDGDNSAGKEFWVRNGWENIAGAIPMARDL